MIVKEGLTEPRSPDTIWSTKKALENPVLEIDASPSFFLFDDLLTPFDKLYYYVLHLAAVRIDVNSVGIIVVVVVVVYRIPLQVNR
jgi:hypothetical protein